MLPLCPPQICLFYPSMLRRVRTFIAGGITPGQANTLKPGRREKEKLLNFLYTKQVTVCSLTQPEVICQDKQNRGCKGQSPCIPGSEWMSEAEAYNQQSITPYQSRRVHHPRGRPNAVFSEYAFLFSNSQTGRNRVRDQPEYLPSEKNHPYLW